MTTFRVLHTSDWHLGQNLYGRSRLPEQRAFIAWLAETVAARHVDVVLIAGDIFDTGTPSSEARETYYRCLLSLRDAGAHTVVLAGNHDYPATLEESRALLAELGATVVARVNPAAPLLELKRRDGAVAGVLVAIPYVRPQDVLRRRAWTLELEQRQDFKAALLGLYADGYRAAQEWRLADPTRVALPILATAHLSVLMSAGQDSYQSEAMRPLFAGQSLRAEDFPTFDYLALGHIHKPTLSVSRTPPFAHYCGSPLALSFDEGSEQKQVTLLEFAPGQAPTIEALATPVMRRLLTLRCAPPELNQHLTALRAEHLALTNPDWLKLELVDNGSGQFFSNHDWQVEMASAAAQQGFEVLRQERIRNTAVQATRMPPEPLAALSPNQVFERRLAGLELSAEQHSALLACHQTALAAALQAVEADGPHAAP
jgi:DNA repair protein SbcD/Mre11